MDGTGNISYGSWWALVVGVVVLAGVAFGFGQYLVRDFTTLGHWYPQHKSIVVGCLSFGYGVLGVLAGNMLAAWSSAGAPTAASGTGIGLLSFVLITIVTAMLYTWLLPQAQRIPHGPRSNRSSS